MGTLASLMPAGLVLHGRGHGRPARGRAQLAAGSGRRVVLPADLAPFAFDPQTRAKLLEQVETTRG
jgi:hypothetical protein